METANKTEMKEFLIDQSLLTATSETSLSIILNL